MRTSSAGLTDSLTVAHSGCVPETYLAAEIATQPHDWRRAAATARAHADALPGDGERVAVIGCGTSLYMARAFAALRESSGRGLTDAWPASEARLDRGYDRVLAISRSGTTTEVLDLLGRIRDAGVVRTAALTAVVDSPVSELADEVVDLGFADEQSVVQTRFATTALGLLRAHLGDDVVAAAADAERALGERIDGLTDTDQATFLGRGWTVGLAHEAALKAREAAQLWAEAYPAMDYRHGPIAIAQPGRVVWMFGSPPTGLLQDVAATGARLVTSELDPMAQLVVAQRFAVALAEARDLDPDRPRHLTRSVVLPRA